MATSTEIDGQVTATLASAEVDLWATYRVALGRFSKLQAGLVARSLVHGHDGWHLTEPSPLNTAEVLRALFLLERHGLTHDWQEPRDVLRTLVNHDDCQCDAQVVSLTLWAAAVARDVAADELFKRLEMSARSRLTQSMVLGWAVSALCEYAQLEGRADRAHQLAASLMTKLAVNQNGRSDLFHASDRREGVLRRRPRETTLSSQTYAILGIATFAATFGERKWLDGASRCGDAIAAQQGSRGQWWWRYDAFTGKVSRQYPVYCVNQDSAVPGALRALQRAIETKRFDDRIHLGFTWGRGANEVNTSMIQSDPAGVARGLEEAPDGYTVNRELYSYQPARFLSTTLAHRAVAA